MMLHRHVRHCLGFVLALFFSCCTLHRDKLMNAYAPMYQAAGEPLCFASGNLPERCFVSIIQLIAAPEKFHGRRVQVQGYVELGFENNHLFPTREFAAARDCHSALWLDVEGLLLQNPSKFSNRYLIVAGVFNAENRGHGGLHSGTIEKIFRFDLCR